MKYIENSSSFHVGETCREDPHSTLLPHKNNYQKNKNYVQIRVDFIKGLTLNYSGVLRLLHP